MATRIPRARPEPRPVGNADFLVDLGLGDPQAPECGFAEVLLPPLAGEADGAGHDRPRLVLRRGVTGALDLYDWWDASRRGRVPPRDVTVTLLGPGRRAVMTWCFGNARPAVLSYAPLRASDGAVLMETIEIAFDEMALRRDGGSDAAISRRRSR